MNVSERKKKKKKGEKGRGVVYWVALIAGAGVSEGGEEEREGASHYLFDYQLERGKKGGGGTFRTTLNTTQLSL